MCFSLSRIPNAEEEMENSETEMVIHKYNMTQTCQHCNLVIQKTLVIPIAAAASQACFTWMEIQFIFLEETMK